jgi:hypothetical protein
MYTISTPSGIIRTDAGVVVPEDQQAASYQDYVSWLISGNGPTQIKDIPALPVIIVTSFQIRKALNAAGLRTSVESAVDGSADMTLKDGWHYAPNFYSNDPFTAAMGAGLGKTPQEMYGLFQLAASL